MTNCHQLELKAQDGKYRLTDVTDIEARLGESVVSKENTLSYKYIEKSKKIENKM